MEMVEMVGMGGVESVSVMYVCLEDSTRVPSYIGNYQLEHEIRTDRGEGEHLPDHPAAN